MTEAEIRSAIADNVELQRRLDDIAERLWLLDIATTCGEWAAITAEVHNG